ncbi:hypothetical protein F2Q70_00037255 [Brassica cretica]|uniref:Uncharacterized protein n=1 Tax=Brassica cretica TaxID=69181 RepID=A0A8S9JRB0_BRACR|nr:hypothetical protein F2Q68_00004922 [Brassica cretica]KAF2583873.1 hypothetical protein F2Q70_00037255 [Brassica cretica]
MYVLEIKHYSNSIRIKHKLSETYPNKLRIGSRMTIGTRTDQAQSLRGYRTCTLSGNYVATELEPSSVATIVELKGHFTRADHVEVDERKNNRSMRISAVDRHQEMPRQMKINIDRCTQVP